MYNSPNVVAGPASGTVAYTGTGSVTFALVTAVAVLATGAILTAIARKRKD
jgi:hypothetical protein